MPLVPTKLKKDMEDAIKSALAREYGGVTPEADADHAKLAAAISDIAIPLVMALTTEAQVIVQPGIPTAGSPASQVSVGPGTGMIT